jgi:hypothetical protein
MPDRPSRRAARKAGEYRLEVPIDASWLGDLTAEEEQDLRVLVRDQSGGLSSATVALRKDRRGSATLEFSEHPGPVTVFVGPATATDEELAQSQTLTLNVGSRVWGDERELTIAPISIAPYWWWWWLRWCQEFVIRGHVVCPDGSPVPGAEVCAYDVDWWFFWSSTQLVGCATTDITGAFEIRFRWCCGYWPWWWWRYRVWELDPILLERVGPVLAERKDLQLGQIGNRPSLAVFEGLLKEEGLVPARSLEAADAGGLETLRHKLLAKLPAAEELARLHIWPWWPWWPWWDCTPDIIFKVTQQCGPGDATTIIDETVGDTRWNIPNPLDVTLVSTSDACCLPGDGHEGECLVVDRVCDIPLASVGGNAGADPSPVGYAYPGDVTPGTSAYNGDRPFAGGITIWKNPGDLIGVDYIELEMFDTITAMWVPLSMGAELGYSREYWEPGATPPTVFPFFPVQTLSGHRVWETREHYEATSGAVWFPSAGWTRAWLSLNYSLLAYLDTSKFADGTYEFRAVGWNDGGGGTLVNRRVIPVCGTDEENRFVLTFDNRVITAVGHDPSHNCGAVHVCTLEPDTNILDVRIDGNSVQPCDTVAAKGSLEIDFQVTDPDGHLAVYSLIATYGLNLSVDLLPLGTIAALSAGTYTGPTYGEALGQGATGPNWYGGTYTLTIPNASSAFPEPCCYQLELRAYKRTIVDCWGGYAHDNITEYSLGVGIC